MYRNLFIGNSFVKIVAVEFGAILKAEFRKLRNWGNLNSEEVKPVEL